MFIGVLRATLRLPENHSLKGKRQVVRSLLTRLQNKFHLSAAETGDLDSWQIAVIGVACVSNTERHADEVLASVIDFIRSERLDAEVLDFETEIIDA
jgi:uncharacterized protein YlxP (DUF503 family)